MTNIKTIALFPVPVSIMNFGSNASSLNSNLISDAFSEMKSNPILDSRSAVHGWQSSADLEKKYESYSELRNHIQSVVMSILKNYGFKEYLPFDELYECKGLWANILTEKGAWHVPHMHGDGKTVFSGVYYPTSGLTQDMNEYYPDEDYSDVDIIAGSIPRSGDLILFDPATSQKRQVLAGNQVNRYPYYGSEVCIRPKKSHLIIFPNYLTHMVAPVLIDDYYRLSVSFSFLKK